MRHTGLVFDPLGAAESAANLTVKMILNPERASRLVEQHARDARIPGLAEVIHQLVQATWEAPAEPGMKGEIRRVVDSVVLYHLMALTKDESASMQARAIAGRELDDLRKWLVAPRAGDASSQAHWSSGGGADQPVSSKIRKNFRCLRRWSLRRGSRLGRSKIEFYEKNLAVSFSRARGLRGRS